MSGSAGSSSSFCFPSSARLRSAGEFARLKQEGRTWPGRFFVLSVLERPGETAPARVGIITSRRVGGAVVRSRVRRKLREMFRLSRPRLRPGFWLVLIARAPAGTADLAALQADWEKLGRRGGIFLAPCSP